MKLGVVALAALLMVSCSSPNDALKTAITHGDVGAVRAALARKPDLEPRCNPYAICKPLALAASHGDMAMVKALVEAGANPNGLNAYGDTAFMVVGDILTAKGGAGDLHEIRAYLLEHGTDPNLVNQHGASAFMGVAALGDVALLALCLAHGGMINQQAPETGYTPLMAAAQFGQVESARWLLAHGADPSLKDASGLTPRQIALEGAHQAVADLMPAR